MCAYNHDYALTKPVASINFDLDQTRIKSLKLTCFSK